MSRPAVADRRDPWLLIEMRHLAALAAIAREGTFGDAALSLGYVQSAVSGQLAMLERLVGTQLVERSRGHGTQTLTEAGTLLLAHSRDILDEFEAAREGMARSADPEPEGLRISISPGLADELVGPLLTTVLAKSFGLQLARVDTVSGDRSTDALLAGEIDVALISDPVEHDGIGTAELARRRPLLVVNPGSGPAHSGRPLALEALCELPLVAWREGWEPSRIEQELAERELHPNVVARADGSDTVLSMVTAGLGAAVLPRCALPATGDLATIELAEPLPERFSGIAWLRSRSSEERVRRFVDLACRLRRPTV
jgi:DNA-binding transcriptional LysR family regulator